MRQNHCRGFGKGRQNHCGKIIAGALEGEGRIITAKSFYLRPRTRENDSAIIILPPPQIRTRENGSAIIVLSPQRRSARAERTATRCGHAKTKTEHRTPDPLSHPAHRYPAGLPSRSPRMGGMGLGTPGTQRKKSFGGATAACPSANTRVAPAGCRMTSIPYPLRAIQEA